MTGVSLLDYIYAALLLAGGVIGYTKAKSTPSLISGVITAILAVISAFLLQNHHPTKGLGLGILTALAVGVFFIRRYGQTRQAMPAIPVIILSALVLIVSAIELVSAGTMHKG